MLLDNSFLNDMSSHGGISLKMNSKLLPEMRKWGLGYAHYHHLLHGMIKHPQVFSLSQLLAS